MSFWSLVWSIVNRYEQQGFQDAIFQAHLNSSRDTSAQKPSMLEAAKLFLFSTPNCYVHQPIVANRTTFVFSHAA